MSTIEVQVSEIIDASPDTIYSIISDYHEGHPAILPERYFTSLTVKDGGKGAGTEIEVAMTVMGTQSLLHMHVTEPDPGRVIVETDPDAGIVTTFTIDPQDYARKSRVTIQTNAELSPGLRGFMERLTMPTIMRRIFNEELVLLANYAQGKESP